MELFTVHLAVLCAHVHCLRRSAYHLCDVHWNLCFGSCSHLYRKLICKASTSHFLLLFLFFMRHIRQWPCWSAFASAGTWCLVFFIMWKFVSSFGFGCSLCICIYFSFLCFQSSWFLLVCIVHGSRASHPRPSRFTSGNRTCLAPLIVSFAFCWCL